MAATDKEYRDQHVLDIVFAVSSILMLISIVWMFVQDYNREFKEEQRAFRDVESAVAQRLAIAEIPSPEEFKTAEEKVKAARAERESNAKDINEMRAEMKAIQPKKELAEKNYQDVKAYLESTLSFYNIEVEHHGVKSAEDKYRGDITRLEKEVADAKAKRDMYVDSESFKEGDKEYRGLKVLQRRLETLETPLTKAESEWKKVNDRFETQAKLSIAKQWGWGDFIRAMPVIDGFASPIKIQQFTINDVPIDYNFKHVTRFDRCMTCHLGIDRPAYTKDILRSLTEATQEQEDKLKQARERLTERRSVLAGTGEVKNIPEPNLLTLTKLPAARLAEGRVNEFCAHPRLELFVGPNSKHPAEKFGCTSCHSGQGSGTDFTLASHTPDNTGMQARWVKEHNWESIHMWDFPMLPMRFIESSCLKCHHQVTDLYSASNRSEAPKLLRGYNLIKENGCFGCHEIQGRKGGRQVGPDLRLEANPPLEDLSPLERARIEADVENMPGNLRKVGPALHRLAEKTNKEWTARWIKSPREFRPDTKMPHFYGLANNDPSLLPEDQKKFPDAEIQSIAYFLFDTSNKYLKNVTDRRKDDAKVVRQDEERRSVLVGKSKLDDAEKTELADLEARIRLRNAPAPLDFAAKKPAGNPANGRILFSERGCLACHVHEGTEKAQGSAGDKAFAPAILGEAQFGPNLSQLAAKLGKTANDKDSARIWLMQWIKDPHVHSPRSRMPVTHLDDQQVADVAAWLLSQTPTDLGSGWADLKFEPQDDEVLKKLAKVYLSRSLPRDITGELLDGKNVPGDIIKELPAEEQELAGGVNTDSLQRYLGRKAVSRLGCYACHDIPGFDNAKPIGVGLADWGKKPADRLAFEDIAAYVKKHYFETPNLVDKDGKPVGPKVEGNDRKLPYEAFFAKALEHHTREGFLHQKLQEPRSYDYNRMLAWDDRARMPQFKFARLRKGTESQEEFEARSFKEEADAREAVMTFILGLVAEPVPTKSINQPSGDRLAEVKGRQVLDKYNCAGCHLIRPGIFEFRNNESAVGELTAAFDRADRGNVFHGHVNWEGRPPQFPDRFEAHGTSPKLADDKIVMRLSQALRFPFKDGYRDIPSFTPLLVPTADLIYPPPAAAANEESLQRFFKDQGPYGGAFTNLLTAYLAKKAPDVYKIEAENTALADTPDARALAPPSLIGQGEKTQPEWLYQFLLDPQPIRRQIMLRMPRFNMSKDEANALVGYFSAVERHRNPGTQVGYPHEFVAQQESLDSSLWKDKTARYVARLNKTKEGDKTAHAQRLAELQPIWQQVSSEAKAHLEGARDRHKYFLGIATPLKEKRDQLEKDKKADSPEFKALDEKYKLEGAKEEAWKREVARLEKIVEDSSLENLQKAWEEKDAYLLDAFRLVTNKDTCRNCHQVGPYGVLGAREGPPLDLAHKRLRPGWVERWVANPKRFLPYTSVMPPYFEAGELKWQNLFPGSSLEQSAAARDVIMALPRIEAIPATRYIALPLPGEKTGDKK